MKCKPIIIWCIVNQMDSSSLTNEEKTIEALIPLVDALFPGINYYSITGFASVMERCVAPVPKKRFAHLESIPEQAVPKKKLDVTEFLPAKGYEWQDSARWQARFKKLLATT